MSPWSKMLAFFLPHRLPEPPVVQAPAEEGDQLHDVQRAQSIARLSAKSKEKFEAARAFQFATFERVKGAAERQDMSPTQEVIAGLLERLEDRWRS